MNRNIIVFSKSYQDDLDYNSLLSMPSSDVLSQLIAMSNANQAAQKVSKKKKNKKPKGERKTRPVKSTVEPTISSEITLVNECLDGSVCHPNASCQDLRKDFKLVSPKFLKYFMKMISNKISKTYIKKSKTFYE